MKHNTPQRPAPRSGRPSPESTNGCPVWCVGTPGHAREDGCHYTATANIPVIRQLNPVLDPPSMAVYVQQDEEGPKVSNAPRLHVCGGDSELMSDQGEQLIVALADQLAVLEPVTRWSAEWRCPRWCMLTAEQHADEARALDHGRGGAVHKSQRWESGNSKHTDVRALFETGLHRGNRPLIYVGDTEIDATTARRLALHLLRAAAFAEIAEAEVS